MLISNADIYQFAAQGCQKGCARIEHGRVTEIGDLAPRSGERIIDADGGVLLPGLNDHHLHLMSLAATRNSVVCGAPDVATETELIAALQGFQGGSHSTWLRGVGYHESVAGDIDRAWLDHYLPQRPVRIQHRSGRLWIVNSLALAEIQEARAKLPRSQQPHVSDNGRLFDMDTTLHLLRDAATPDLQSASHRLASYGVSGFTDMTPSNHVSTLTQFAQQQASGQLLQHVRLAGRPQLQFREGNVGLPCLCIGATKIHLHESHLPGFDELCATISASHQQGREVAVHCVTQVELVFTLAAFREVQVQTGDRIEHASLTPPPLLEQIAELGLTVVTQPNFIAERGDAYLTDVPTAEHDWLYRAQSFLSHQIPLAGGSDAPFGHDDPWRAMTAAVQRRTASNRSLGEREALSPEQALDLFLGALETPAQPRRIEPGVRADLCLLDCPWAEARLALSSARVRATLRAGELIFDRIDEPPG